MERNFFKIADMGLIVETDKNHIYRNMWAFATPETELQLTAMNVAISVVSDAVNYQKPELSELIPRVKTSELTIYENAESFISLYPKESAVSHCVHRKESLKTLVYLKNEVPDNLNSLNPQSLEISAISPKASATLDDHLMYAIRDAFLFHAQKLGRIAVHSASIIYKNSAWLFSAPSGTGKSTHVSLWQQENIDFESLNGDLCLLYEKDGDVVAAGTPWCGTSDIFCNRQLTLGGVLFLEQSRENSLTECDRTEAGMRLFARCLTPNWSIELTKKNATAVNRITKCGHYAVLKCMPDSGAVEVSKKYIDSAN